MKLRPYQEDALEAIRAAKSRGLARVLLALPTGAGKTVIFARLIAEQGGRALVLAHRRELVEQAQRKIAEVYPQPERVEIEMGSQRCGAQARVVVASIRSLSPKRLQRILDQGSFELVVYDECHHATAAENRGVLDRLGLFAPESRALLVGVTATTRRADGEGLDRVFQEIVYARSLGSMIEDGYLRPLRGFTISTGMGWKGDLLAQEEEKEGHEALADAVDVEDRNALVARSIQELARDRRCIAFCITVRHAERLARALNYFGVRAGMVCGAMPQAARQATLDAFRAGKLSVITNVGVLTEGFDDPGVSAIAMVRPTRSESLYIQCVGRGMRLSPEAKDCLVLDFVDLFRLDLVTLPSLAGLPRAMNLQGELVHEAVQDLGIQVDWLADIVEDEDISLSELKARAQAFDPLTQSVDPEILAMSSADWFSLGPRGVGLYVQGSLPRTSGISDPSPAAWLRNELRRREIWVIEVLRKGRAGRYQVYWDGQMKEEFTRLLDAIEAVDYELGRRGPKLWASAQADASWRRAQVPQRLAESLRLRGGKRMAPARSLHEALRQLRWLDRYRRSPSRGAPA